jgi:hypothetical protein
MSFVIKQTAMARETRHVKLQVAFALRVDESNTVSFVITYAIQRC